MRPLEIIILTTIPLIIYLLFRDDKKWFLYALFFGLMICLIHFIYEQYRWQMVPAYFLFLFLYILYRWRQSLSLFICLALLLWFSVSVFIPHAVPVVSLPVPSGKHDVGTQIFQWADSSRAEWFTGEDSTDLRKIMVQIWYPTQKNKNKLRSPYIDNIDLRVKAIGAAGGFPGWLSGHMNLIKTHSYLMGEPLSAQGPYPLLILSHGLTGMRQIHTSLIENLASHGYVVAAVDHPYDCNLTVFQDGTVANYRSDITGHPDSVNIRKMQLSTRVNDIVFVLEKISELHSSSSLGEIINLSKVGVLGHSYGGATAINSTFNDSRFRACLALDGWMNPLPSVVLQMGINQPFLSLARPHWNDSDYPSSPSLVKRFISADPENKYQLVLKNSRHLDFCDAPLFSPFSGFFIETGSIPSARAVSVTNNVVLMFFDRFLKEKSNEFLVSILNEPYLKRP